MDLMPEEDQLTSDRRARRPIALGFGGHDCVRCLRIILTRFMRTHEHSRAQISEGEGLMMLLRSSRGKLWLQQ